MKTGTFLSPLLLLTLLLASLSACGGHEEATAAARGQGIATATPAPTAPAVIDLRPLILAAARSPHPAFDQLQSQSVVDVDAMIQSKAGFDPLPSIQNEADAALKALYAEAATLYQLNEVIAAQALLRTAGPLSPAGDELRTLVDEAYMPVGDPESLEVQGEQSAGEAAQELQDYAQRATKGLASLRLAHLEGQQRELAELRVKAGVYHDTNGAAIAAAEAALKATGDDPKTRRAIEKALADAAR